MSRLTGGKAALIARQQAGATSGGAVTYARAAGGASVDLTGKAWWGRTVFRRNPLADQNAASVVFGERDYMIPVADLAQSGTAFHPARGDRITETVGGKSKTFEVIAPQGEDVWRYDGPDETLFRVHTKRVVV